MFQCGILPMEKTGLDMRRALQQLSPEDARVLKRKFRKLWRTAMKKQNEECSTRSKKAHEDASKVRLGVGKHVPSRQERNERKKLVFDLLWNEVIGPMVENFDNVVEAKDRSSKKGDEGHKET